MDGAFPEEKEPRQLRDLGRARRALTSGQVGGEAPMSLLRSVPCFVRESIRGNRS